MTTLVHHIFFTLSFSRIHMYMHILSLFLFLSLTPFGLSVIVRLALEQLNLILNSSLIFACFITYSVPLSLSLSFSLPLLLNHSLND